MLLRVTKACKTPSSAGETMGLLDSYRTATPTFDPPKAIMTILIAAIKADGAVASEEVALLRGLCIRSPLFSANTAAQDDALIEFADKVTDQFEGGAVKLAGDALPPSLRETAFAFALACDLLIADGVVGSTEDRFLTTLSGALQVPGDVVQSVIQCALIRHRNVR